MKWLFAGLLLTSFCYANTTIEEDWANPPRDARLRAYWWWINGNVDKDAITRDLEEMKAKGFGGALICDADGSAQEGNVRAPRGPVFMSDAWRDLYRHTLKEADRLGLEMSLNIQSGWNVGGPSVKAEDAPKKLVWSETRSEGGKRISCKLAQPKAKENFYRDLFVLAYRAGEGSAAPSVAGTLAASSSQAAHPAERAIDNSPDNFWVSDGQNPGDGPTAKKPQWIGVTFDKPEMVSAVNFKGRKGYAPKKGDVCVSEDGVTFRSVKPFNAKDGDDVKLSFEPVRAKAVRLMITDAYDSMHPNSSRTVQVMSFTVAGTGWSYPAGNKGQSSGQLKNQGQKALLSSLRPFSAPDSSPLFEEDPAKPGEQQCMASDVVDLTGKVLDGLLTWDAPAGNWTILRIGFTLNDHNRVSTCSQGWEGYALDPFDAGAFTRYWDAVVEPLMADAKPFKSLRYLHTDSWEVEVANWTPTLREAFLKRRGYDLLSWLPVIAGKIVNSRDESNRFLHDFRRTMGDLAMDNHFRLFKEGAQRHGMLIHPESGGPHSVPIDAQQCLGFNDAPMSEFWATSWRHRMGDDNRYFVKQPASAAHVNGRKLVLAEGFTTIGPHWQETLWDNLKPSFDKAICEGLNLLVWHAFVCSPASEGVPGQQYFAGTHLNPLVTWWKQSGSIFGYFNRCHAMMQRGKPYADVLYYYGSHVPNFTQHKRKDPTKVLPGYDYDVIDADALLTRITVKDGKLVTPDGVRYRILVLSPHEIISLEVMKKVRALVAEGATVVAQAKPLKTFGLNGYQAADAELKRITDELWSGGKLVTDKSAVETLKALGVAPDVSYQIPPELTESFDFIHRIDGDSDIYFLANRSTNAVNTKVTFRMNGKGAELWNPVSGERTPVTIEQTAQGSIMNLDFNPCGSWVVVWKRGVESKDSRAPVRKTIMTLAGPWQVSFDPKWAGPATPVTFNDLSDWSSHSDPGIKYYSGTAVYRTSFKSQVPGPKSRIFLDLGNVRELAEVKVNGKACGMTWTPPFRVDISDALKPGVNEIEVHVTNFWYNRLVGDKDLPQEKRVTRTNIRKLSNPGSTLMASGLLGPVILRCAE